MSPYKIRMLLFGALTLCGAAGTVVIPLIGAAFSYLFKLDSSTMAGGSMIWAGISAWILSLLLAIIGGVNLDAAAHS